MVGRRASLMPGAGGATLNPRGGAMQQQPGGVPNNTGPWTPGDSASQIFGTPKLRGDRGASAVPLPPGREPSRYNQVAGEQPPTYIEDVDINQNIWSPFQPVVPFGPPYVGYPRTFDYPVGLNLDFTSQGRLSFFKMLQVMSRSWGILRTVIETRKDELMRLPWAIQLKDKPKNKTHPRVIELTEFLRKPDKQHNFSTWLRMQLEDRFVIDAANYYVWKDLGGKPFALMQVAGETIKPLIDDAGRRPEYPNPAYQQLVKGLPWVNLDASEFVYAPMRPTPQEPIYGYSEIQMIYIEILQGIRKMLYKLSYWDEGNIPQLMITVPSGWTPEQLAAFQAHMDVMLSGNVPFKSRIRFMPSDSKPFDIKNANGELLKTDEDEWVARLVCYAFSVSPQPFIRQMNRSTAETADQEAEEEGLFPTMSWIKEALFDPVIQDPLIGFGYDDCEFVWLPEKQFDPVKQMTVITGYTKVGVMTMDEGREQLDMPPYPGGAGSEPVVITPQGPIPFNETLEANKAKALAVPDQLDEQQQIRQQMMENGGQQQPPAPPLKSSGGQKTMPSKKTGGGGGQQATKMINGREVDEPSRAPFRPRRAVRKDRSEGYGWKALAEAKSGRHESTGGHSRRGEGD